MPGTPVVTFGGAAATGVQVESDTEITCTTPPGSGAVAVSVTVDGQSGSKDAAFTYAKPPPAVTSLTPATGAAAGGDQVTITGSGFQSS
jgi:hypothetical protein